MSAISNHTASKTELSDNSLGDLFEHRNFGIGVYRGSVVFIKKVHKKSIDLTRSVRKELIQVSKCCLVTR